VDCEFVDFVDFVDCCCGLSTDFVCGTSSTSIFCAPVSFSFMFVFLQYPTCQEVMDRMVSEAEDCIRTRLSNMLISKL
jgi:hypothetical protein